MARTPLPYTTSNSLHTYIIIRKAEKSSEKGGSKVLIREIEDELAEYCSIKRDAIVMIKRGLNQPSLPVAMKICEYFGCTVEEMFQLKGMAENS